MKIVMRELEIELEAETKFERGVLKRILLARQVKVEFGTSKDHNWPPDLAQTNVILRLPNPDDWGT